MPFARYGDDAPSPEKDPEMTGYPWEIQPKPVTKEPVHIVGGLFVLVVAVGGVWFFVRLAAPSEIALITGLVLGGLPALVFMAFSRSARYQKSLEAALSEARQPA